MLLGTGRLTWDRSERVSDRYGVVYLLATGDSLHAGPTAPLATLGAQGKSGTLIAHVLEARESTHIGDLFNMVFPVTPEVGERIVLGLGRLYATYNADGKNAVRLEPEDGRPDQWMDIHALYRAHEQTVELLFEE